MFKSFLKKLNQGLIEVDNKCAESERCIIGELNELNTSIKREGALVRAATDKLVVDLNKKTQFSDQAESRPPYQINSPEQVD